MSEIWVFPDSPEAERRHLVAEADRLRLAARELRAHAEALGPLLRRVVSFDRPDVWRGGVADQHRAAMVEVTRQLGSPWAGAFVGLVEAAARLEARATAATARADAVTPPALPGPPPWPTP